MTSDIRAKRRPSDWRRPPGISAAQAATRDLVVRGVWAVDFIGDRRSLDVGS